MKGERHSLSEHARSTAALAGRFAREAGAERLGFLLGLLHDLGKARPCWQEGLELVEGSDKPVGVKHKEAGAARLAPAIGPMALAVLGHHGGLTSVSDLRAVIEAAEAGTFGDQQEVWAKFSQALPEAVDLVRDGAAVVPSSWIDDPLRYELGLRMVFSALVDADHLDTSAHFAGFASPRVRPDEDMTALARRFETQRELMLRARVGSPIDQVRERVYQEVMRHAAGRTGVYRMPAPTGVGKTLSAAGFGLRHAAEHNKRRVIIAVPFITVTEQNAGEYRKLLGADVVLEHHSAVNPPDGGAASLRWRAAAENWDSPLVVTTTVQLFESLFARKPSKMRKVHRLANSVIVLDEVQALPLDVLVPILNALRVLSESFGTTVLLTSATQPAFEHLPEWADVDITSVVDDPPSLFARLRRVEYEWWLDPKPTTAEVADAALKHDQALMVVNTTADARHVYQHWATSESGNVWHLSTRMCAAHRREVLATVNERLATGQRVHLVSTQLIEAGVDVDFPVVFRAMAPADALQQAAGRANREGKLAGFGKVVIFDAEDMSAPNGYAVGTPATHKHFGPHAHGVVDPDDLRSLDAYFKAVYSRKNTNDHKRSTEIQRNRKNLDFIAVTDGPARSGRGDRMRYRDRALAFRMLDDDTVSVVVTGYDERAGELLDELRDSPNDARQALRALQPYVVSLPQQTLNDDVIASLCQPVASAGDLYEWQGDYCDAYGIDTSTLVREEVW